MNMDLSRVVRFTNITTQTFVHAYGGVPYTFEAGEARILPYDLARHLAKHLARKVLFADGENKRNLLNKAVYDISLDRPLHTKQDEDDLIGKILGDVSHAPVAPELSPNEVIKQRVKELNAEKPEDAPQEDETKKDLINRMMSMGLQVDKRKSAETLRSELAMAISAKEAEADGIKVY